MKGSSSVFVASDSAREDDVSREKGGSFGVMGAQVSIFQQIDHSSLTGLLKSQQGRCLETEDSVLIRVTEG